MGAHGPVALPQVIQQPPKPGALIRPPQVTLTQTPMVALRQPHSRIVLTAPQQIQLNQLQPGEGRGPHTRGSPPPPPKRPGALCCVHSAVRPSPRRGDFRGNGSSSRCWVLCPEPLLHLTGALVPLPRISGEGSRVLTGVTAVGRQRCPPLSRQAPERLGPCVWRGSGGTPACPAGRVRRGGAWGTRAARGPLLSCVAVPVVKPAVLPGTKALSAVSAQAAAAQKNKLKEPGGGSFRYGAHCPR